MKPTIKSICAGMVVAALCTAFTACNEPKNTQNFAPQVGDVPFTVLSSTDEATGYELPVLRMERDYFYMSRYEGKVFIVNSDKELKRYVAGDYPPIDFSTKSVLLIGGGPTQQSPIVSTVRSFRFSSEGVYKLEVDIEEGFAMLGDIWMKAILTDKMSGDSRVELNVTVIEPTVFE